MLSPKERQALIANARRLAAAESKRCRSWRCVICGATVHDDRIPRRRNRACPTCRQTRADEVADLYLGAWEREAL